MYTMNWGRLPTWGVKWERRFCSPINGMADKEKLQPASCLTDGRCRHAQGLKKNWKAPTLQILVCSDAWRKHKRQHVCWRKRWNIFFNHFFPIFSQLCSLEADINFRKIKHPNKTSTKLLTLEMYAVSCAYTRGWIKPSPSQWAWWLEYPSRCYRLCHGWLDGGAGQRGVGISKILVVASTAMLGCNLYV